MAITFTIPASRSTGRLRAVAILVRAAFGLFVHGLIGFGRPCAINRATGEVQAR